MGVSPLSVNSELATKWQYNPQPLLSIQLNPEASTVAFSWAMLGVKLTVCTSAKLRVRTVSSRLGVLADGYYEKLSLGVGVLLLGKEQLKNTSMNGKGF